jgi:nucleoside-diphosphate-sugar epimerase
MTRGLKVAVIGASGFVGAAVVNALRTRGCEVKAVRAPRLRTALRQPADLLDAANSDPVLGALATELAGSAVVVNAAGCPDASSLDEQLLLGGNALLPAICALAAARAGARRLVHISSAVVQNDVPVLDESEDLRPFSPYSESKVAGEEVLRNLAQPGFQVIRYRPPSVHAPDRRVSRMITRIAGSRAASVARPGDQPTPQALLPNVADAVAHLATTRSQPPGVVVHPSEGVTVVSLMRDLSGGREPLRLPRSLAATVVRAAKVVGRWHGPTAANARRVELLWLGQGQTESWLIRDGWQPVAGPEEWRRLGEDVRMGGRS